ncbi:sulfite oxidase-like oxidoreductase [Conexibacter sp. DBS9H8]|uniref:sulfite oxidase-like oxidoreductase n=1 Tax=Conexibacter sp. DBS9H8 TaxID=2937801 RepID=UPI00200C2695|nr:sulfite oxidase-like oxidoreductase [Conexibacter sp. DBS9H8]
MPITAKFFGERGRRRAESLGIDPLRLPPGQSPTTKWPVLDLGRQPDVGLEAWRLRVDGAVTEPLSLGYAELLGLAQTTWTDTDIHCVTRWSQFGMSFTGVEVHTLLELAGLAADASHLLVHGYDGYSTNVPLSDVSDGRGLIVHAAQGGPLTREHGGPVRLLIPHLYLWKSAKWLSRLEVLTEDRLGFWEENGYHHRGDPWAEERYSEPEYLVKLRRRELRGGAPVADPS